MSNRQVLFCHEQAFADQNAVLRQLAQQVPGFTPLVVPASRVTVEEAVATYLFNSQLLSRADGSMALILPQKPVRIRACGTISMSCWPGITPSPRCRF